MKRWIHATTEFDNIKAYIPKEFKKFVVDCYNGEKEYDEETKRFYTPIIVEWENGEVSSFKSKEWMRFNLKESHFPEEFSN